MRLGIFARTFVRDSLEAVLDAVVEHAVSVVQFNLALAGGPSLPDGIGPELAARVAEAHRERKLELAAISGTYNMAHPAASAREQGATRLAVLIAAAPALGASVVTLCTGTRDPDDMWRAHPDNASRAAWDDMCDSVARAVEVAERAGVTLAIEPEHSNVVGDARAARRLLDELRTPALKVVIDAANLLDPAALARQRDILAEARDLIGGDLVLAHAKDKARDGRVVAAGAGAVDFDGYLTLLSDAGYTGPLVLHGLAEHEVPEAVAHLRGLLA